VKYEEANSFALNDQQEKEFSSFEKFLSLWKDAYQCAVISYVGAKTAQGQRLLFGRIVLEPSRMWITDKKFKFETKHVIAACYMTNATWPDIKSFLARAKSGRIAGIDNTMILECDKGRNLSVYFDPIHHPLITEGPRLPCLLIRGIPKHDLLIQAADSRQLDWELKASDIPFDNLDELLMQCSLPTLTQMGDLTVLEVVARSPALISDKSTIMDGEARIMCFVANALDIGKIRIGYKVFHKGFVVVDRASVSGTTLEWQQENDTKTGICRVPVGDAPLLQAFLSYAGVSLHQSWVTDPQKHLNPRHAIHQVFDEDMELLKMMLLKPESDKPYAFEGAVSTLCNLLGFSVVNYGRIPKLQKGPDIIAVTPAGNIGVIECTVGLLNENDKLAKLVQRTTLIKGKLTGAGYGHLQILAAIVTPLSRKEVVADLEAASKHNIAVICKEDIEKLLVQASLPPNPENLFQEVKRLL
jgi:hypothetical protein